LTRQNTGLPAVSLRLGPVLSRSLPAVSFSGLDGVKSRQGSDLTCPSNKSASQTPAPHYAPPPRTSARKSARSGAGGAGLRSLLDQPETQQLERKSSFLASTDPKHSDIPQYVIQHKVGKSVAALANTDGGYVITGQADDLTIVGLADDFAQITKNSGRDGFELRLVEYINTSLHPRLGHTGPACALAGS